MMTGASHYIFSLASLPHPASSVLVQWRGVALGQGMGLQGEADIDISYISSVCVAVREIRSRDPPSDSKKGQHRLVINNQPVKLSSLVESRSSELGQLQCP